MVDLAHAQDVEAGDGTTTVTIMAGAMLGAVMKLLDRGFHPTSIAESFLKAAHKADEILQGMAIPVDLTDEKSLLASANTALNSKVNSSQRLTSMNSFFFWFVDGFTIFRDFGTNCCKSCDENY